MLGSVAGRPAVAEDLGDVGAPVGGGHVRGPAVGLRGAFRGARGGTRGEEADGEGERGEDGQGRAQRAGAGPRSHGGDDTTPEGSVGSLAVNSVTP